MSKTLHIDADTGEILNKAADRLTGQVADVIDRGLVEKGDAPLFEANAYDDPRLQLDTKEGRRIDEIVIAFNGSIVLNRLNVDDVDLWRRLKMGQEVQFQVDGKVVGDALTIKPPTEKRRELLSGKRTIGVHSLEEVD